MAKASAWFSSVLVVDPEHDRGVFEDRSLELLFGEHLDRFQAGCTSFAMSTASALGGVRALTDSETLTYLHACVSTSDQDIGVPPGPILRIAEMLTDRDVALGQTMRIGDDSVHIVSVRGYPTNTSTGLMRTLSSLPFGLRVVHRFIPMSASTASAALDDIERAANKAAMGQDDLVLAEDIKAAKSVRANVQQGRETLGYHTVSLVVRGASEQVAKARATACVQVAESLGFAALHEGMNLRAAWFGSLPGHRANKRRFTLSALNFAHLLPCYVPYKGDEVHPKFGSRALMVCRTRGQGTYYLNLHASASGPGHAIVVGPTRSGKSAFGIACCLGHLGFPRARVVYLDNGRSSMAACLSTGGTFCEIGLKSTAGHTPLQPLARCDDPAERRWLTSWLATLARRLGAQHVNLSATEEFERALLALAAFAPRFRTITGLKKIVQHEELRSVLEPMCAPEHAQAHAPEGAGLTGWSAVFDGDSGPLDLSGAWSSVEVMQLEEFLEQPDNAPYAQAAIDYVFHSFTQAFEDRRPTLLFLDEAWLWLERGEFAKKVKSWTVRLAKYNVSVVFATQHLDQFFSSPVSKVVLGQVDTKVLLPNRDAMHSGRAGQREEYGAGGLGLNDAQIDRLARATPRKEYYVVTRGQGSSLMDMDLGPLELALAG
ncbi:MAG: hypothetical protein AAGI01_16285, partial [Myxococcota bacterium]